MMNMVYETYTQPASYFVKDERICIIEFLEEQLKTGVAHTSFSNTFIVGLLIMFGIERMVTLCPGTAHDPPPLVEMDRMLRQLWRGMGITMKLKLYADSTYPCMTFHKRYFVPVDAQTDAFCACPLPSTIVKMCAVRAPQLMGPKRFWQTLRQGAQSRAGCAQNPLTRIFINRLTETRPTTYVQKVESVLEGVLSYPIHTNLFHDSNPGSSYSGNYSTVSWAELHGDGLPDAHFTFMEQRYGISKEDAIWMMDQTLSMDFTQCHRHFGTKYGDFIWGMFVTDYG
jgi:hypothetical protein